MLQMNRFRPFSAQEEEQKERTNDIKGRRRIPAFQR